MAMLNNQRVCVFFTGRNDLSLVLSTFWAANAWDHKEKNTRFALQTVTLGKPFSSLIRTRTTIFLCICISYIFLYVYLSINPNMASSYLPISERHFRRWESSRFPSEKGPLKQRDPIDSTSFSFGSHGKRRIHNDAVNYVSPQMYGGRRHRRIIWLCVKMGHIAMPINDHPICGIFPEFGVPYFQSKPKINDSPRPIQPGIRQSRQADEYFQPTRH